MAPSCARGRLPLWRSPLKVISAPETINLGLPSENGFSIVPARLHVAPALCSRHLAPMFSSWTIRPIRHEVFGARLQCIGRCEIGEIGDHYHRISPHQDALASFEIDMNELHIIHRERWMRSAQMCQAPNFQTSLCGPAHRTD